MPYITWKSEYDFNITNIDEQHHLLVDTINQLFDAMEEGKGERILTEVFKNLVAYINLHFKTEEALMSSIQFPGYLEHKKAHEDCTKIIIDFKSRYESGEALTNKLFQFLSRWLHYHLLQIDMQYREALKSSGLV